MLTAVAVGKVTVTATAVSGVSAQVEIEVYSDFGAVAGFGGAAVATAAGVTYYFKRKKRWS